MSGVAGRALADDKEGLVSAARARAEKWFGRATCLSISLGQALDDGQSFSADYEAQIVHSWRQEDHFSKKCSICSERVWLR